MKTLKHPYTYGNSTQNAAALHSLKLMSQYIIDHDSSQSQLGWDIFGPKLSQLRPQLRHCLAALGLAVDQHRDHPVAHCDVLDARRGRVRREIEVKHTHTHTQRERGERERDDATAASPAAFAVGLVLTCRARHQGVHTIHGLSLAAPPRQTVLGLSRHCQAPTSPERAEP